MATICDAAGLTIWVGLVDITATVKVAQVARDPSTSRHSENRGCKKGKNDVEKTSSDHGAGEFLFVRTECVCGVSRRHKRKYIRPSQ